MSLPKQRQRVVQARAQLASQLERTRQQAGNLQDTVRQSLSPARVVTAGALSGFLTGLFRPERLHRSALQHAKNLGALPSLLTALLPVWQQLQTALQTKPDTPDEPPADTP